MIGDLIERVASGELHVEIDRSFPLAEAAAAHAYLEEPKGVRAGGDGAAVETAASHLDASLGEGSDGAPPIRSCQRRTRRLCFSSRASASASLALPSS